MEKKVYTVSVATVTYGNRWYLLEQVLKRILSFPQVKQVVIVDNASEYPVVEKVKELNDIRLFVISNLENKGSAGGYSDAINFAVNNIVTDFVFLLDDDNLPTEDSLSNLLSNWDIIEGDDNRKALFCLREDRPQHVKISKGEDAYRFYLVPDNFLGFNIFRIFKNQLNKLIDKLKVNRCYKKFAKMPYVPYGGLLLHISIIKEIGLPDARFFLYVDDSEYTYRITQINGNIWLIPSSKIIDIEKSQGLEYKTKLFHSKLLDQWNFRTYYQIRNRLYFYSKVAIKSEIIFKINKILFLNYLLIVSLLSSKNQQYRKVLQAVKDGLNGKLGKADNEKF